MGVQILDNKERVLRGLNMNADIVGSTLGPRGRNVGISFQGKGMLFVKDGVTVSRQIYLDDPWEQIGSGMVQSACSGTVDAAGDGTTTTALLLQAMVKLCGARGFDVERGVRQAIKDVQAEIEKGSRKIVNGEDLDYEALRHVAWISANGREELVIPVIEMFRQLGRYGQIYVEQGSTSNTETEVLNGYVYEGETHGGRYFFNRGDHLDLEECYVVIINEEVTEFAQISEVIGKYHEKMLRNPKAAKPLVIFGAIFSGQALASLAGNIQAATRNPKAWAEANPRLAQAGITAEKAMIYPVSLPGQGDERHQMLIDMAALTGAEVFNHLRGTPLKHFGVRVKDNGKKEPEDHFGVARRVRVSNGRVYLFADGEHDGGEEKAKLIEFLKTQEDPLSKKRLSKLKGGIGVIRVGAASELERGNFAEVVDDMVRALYSAIDGGVSAGAGVTLSYVREKMLAEPATEYDAGYQAVVDSLRAIQGKLFENSGEIPPANPACPDIWTGHVAGEGLVNCWDAGILDPTNVLKAAVENAARSAILFFTTNYYINIDG